MSKCAEFKFDLICEIIFDKFFQRITMCPQGYHHNGFMTTIYMVNTFKLDNSI